jgi:deoxyribodipyrimidine photo-lyase
VPVDLVASRAAYAARSLRPTLGRLADGFAAALPRVHVARPWSPRRPVAAAPGFEARVGLDVTDELDRPAAVVARLDLAGTAPRADQWFEGGQVRAARVLERFVAERLGRYARDRRAPAAASTSGLGMYLRFGHVSAALIWRAVRDAAAGAPTDAVASFQEELLVRRELAVNLVHFTPHYDRYDVVPAWARASLAAHVPDPRPFRYGLDALRAADTHDPAWNAAMLEMRTTGYLHNHMRMYWGKKILEWSDTPEEAFAAALTLNDAFLLDGRDPNSYAGVAWVFGLHDRPWGERPIYGMVRSMTAAGLRRKSDPDAYVRYVHDLVAQPALALRPLENW